MKVSSLLLLPLVLLGVACERHSADSLPKHDNHSPAPSETPAPAKSAEKPAEKAAPEKEQKKEGAPAEAPKFFDGAAPK
jgi:hypothetical protein